LAAVEFLRSGPPLQFRHSGNSLCQSVS